MTTETVNVKYVNPPKEGKEWWLIKDASGISYWRKEPIQSSLAGQTCQITFNIGKDDFRKLIAIGPVGGGTPQSASKAPKTRRTSLSLLLPRASLRLRMIKDVAHVSRALKVLRSQWRDYKTEEPEPIPEADMHGNIPDFAGDDLRRSLSSRRSAPYRTAPHGNSTVRRSPLRTAPRLTATHCWYPSQCITLKIYQSCKVWLENVSGSPYSQSAQHSSSLP